MPTTRRHHRTHETFWSQHFLFVYYNQPHSKGVETVPGIYKKIDLRVYEIEDRRIMRHISYCNRTPWIRKGSALNQGPGFYTTLSGLELLDLIRPVWKMIATEFPRRLIPFRML